MLKVPRFFAALVLAWSLAGAALAQPPVWVVRAHGATLVLFGSVHLLPAGLDWRPPALNDALAKADDLWFEIPLDDASALAAQTLAIKHGLEPAGISLRSQLTPEDQARLAKVAAQYGLPVEGLDHLKPWLAEITLSLAAYRQAGAAQDEGVERQLSISTPPTVPRRAFETTEQQIDYLSQGSDPDQIASLREALGELEEGRASFDRLVSAWMAGDTGRIESEAVTPLRNEAPGVYRTLVVERNRRWVKQIEQRLRGRGTAVMVVGVGHLVGPDSVPAMLRAEGIAIEGP
jgi:uncharacterized protein YbaP (TraB family)